MKYIKELNHIIRTRRSVKPELFSSRKVEKEQILTLLENARWAPTHGLTQPWYFVVFMGEGVKRLSEFQSETYKQITPADSFNEKKYNKLKDRPLCCSAILAICMKRQESEKIPEIEEVEAVACAMQNMFLTSTAMGMAAYWGSGGLTYTDEMKTFLGLGEKDKCLGFFYLGYVDNEVRDSRRNEIESFVGWVAK